MSQGPQGKEASSAGRGAADAIGAEDVENLLFAPGGVERRMHSRAYHHWISLLEDDPYPRIERLDPAAIADFAAHSVLLDFRGGAGDPRIAYIGRELREECGLVGTPDQVADLPERSLLARLTGRYEQILATKAPVGFEAEFVNARDRTTLYRGVLLPFSSDGRAIDFVYGVINWKELADPSLQASIDSALMAAMQAGETRPPPTAEAPWPMADSKRAAPRRTDPSAPGQTGLAVDAAPGTPVILVGQVGEDGALVIQRRIVGDTRLVDRLLRATH